MSAAHSGSARLEVDANATAVRTRHVRRLSVPPSVHVVDATQLPAGSAAREFCSTAAGAWVLCEEDLERSVERGTLGPLRAIWSRPLFSRHPSADHEPTSTGRVESGTQELGRDLHAESFGFAHG